MSVPVPYGTYRYRYLYYLPYCMYSTVPIPREVLVFVILFVTGTVLFMFRSYRLRDNSVQIRINFNTPHSGYGFESQFFSLQILAENY